MAGPGNRERLLEKFPRLPGKKFVLFFGRLSFKKGMDILAEGFVKVARERGDVHLVVVGPDPEGFGGKIRARLGAAEIFENATFSGPLGD
jgi:glycosyltransferase involved in cell wall biosynthesis